MKYETLPGKSLAAWEVMGALLYGLLIFLANWLIPAYTTVWYTVLWIFGALFIVTAFLYLPLFFVNAAYCLEEDRIFLKSGVIFRKRHIMMRDNISFVTVYSTPFNQLLRLGGVVISAPGSRMMILFIDIDCAHSIAAKISDDLILETRHEIKREPLEKNPKKAHPAPCQKKSRQTSRQMKIDSKAAFCP